MNFAKSNTRPDDGSWLSAQQAVLPDGTEVGNLPLVNKKLPQLYPPSNPQPAEPQSKLQAAIEAMEFAIAAPDGLDYLRAWLRSDAPAIREKWPTAPLG